ncbi:MAG: methylmalonyl-CoA mutase family protein, partial [Deltaproteobacteria bacterium]|nr:methylmalonyl-CoA mutase family protein [Deltaproteobacteria bacterium]
MTAKTQSGIPLQAFYTSKDCNFDIPDPGEYPFVRGIFAELYSKKPWTIRQYSGFGSAKSTNQRFQELIREGQEGLSVAFDLPTQMGLDPDDVRAEGEVGKVGVSVATLDDFELLFESIPLDKVSVSMTINATAPILMAFLVTTAKRRGVDWSRLRGTVQNDILKEFIARGTYIYPLDFSLRLACDLSEFCIQNIPGFNWSSISGYHMREAGANAVQELAFTFLNFIVYVEQLLARGIEITKILRRTSFFFDCLMDFFE